MRRADDQRQYLFSILTSLTKPTFKPSPRLLRLHIHHLPITLSEEEQAAIVTPHAAQHPSDPALQREKLSLLSNTADSETIRKAFKESMKACVKPDLSPEDKRDVIDIFTGYLEWESSECSTFALADGFYKRILRETLRQDCIAELHPTVLASYYEFSLSRQSENTSPLAILEPIISTYSPSHEFYHRAFEIISEQSTDPQADLQKVYMRWRASARSNSDKVSATLRWVDWLLENQEGKKAYDAIEVMRREVRSDEAALAELEAGWVRVMEDAEGIDSGSSEEDGESDERSGSESEDEDEDEDVIME